MNTSARRNESGFLARALIVAGFLFYAASGFAWEVTPNFSWLELLPPGSYMDSWSFEETNWDSDFGFAPLSCSNIVQVPDWDSNALQVDATNAAWLTYSIAENAPRYGEYTNLTLGTGSIEFLFSPNWESADTNYYGSGPDDFGRFIEAGTWGTNTDSDWWSLYLNPSGTGIYFSSGTNGVRTNYLSAPISWGESWHMIVLTYSQTNTYLYLDGQLAASGDGVRYVPSGNTLTNGFSIGSDFATGLQQAHGQFDDLYTYKYQLSADDVSNDYAEIYPELPGSFHPDDGGGPFPGDGGGGTNGDGGDYFPGVPLPDYGTNLYLTITNASNNQASGWINNSSIFVPYTVFSRQSLLWPIWSPEATFYGSWSTNLTAFSVPVLARSNLFLEARSEIAPRIVGGGNSQFGALRRDGTVWTWGDGNYGQLGNGQWTNSDTTVQVLELSNVVAIAVPPTGDYTLALDAYGKVWSWGTNYSGQLGRHDGLYEAEDTPAVIPGLSNIVAIAGGSGHALALKSDGTVWAWGDNAYGDLGNGTNTQRDYALPVSGLTNAIAIASGDCHCFALCADGTVRGWGLNEDWELGISNAIDQWIPVLVTHLTNAVALSGGYYHSIALLSNGTIEAWGANYFGEIGDISSSTPVPVSGLSNIVSIASGGFHNLFINTNGNLFAWGNDLNGQFGDDGANIDNPYPYLLTTVSNVTAIAGGNESSIISTGNGNIYTFGDSYEYESAPTLTDLYTNYSSDGSGLPDWWELMYFHHLGLNPSADPVGDGWTLLQDYEQGLNPTNFITPPAITGLAVTQTNALGDIILNWSAETPTPLNYAIYRIDYNYTNWQYGTAQEIGEVANNITTFTDTGSVPGGDDNSIYEVDGIYGGGTSPFSAQSYVNSQAPATLADNLPFTAALVRNGTGRWQIMFSGIPTGIQTIQLSWQLGSSSTIQDISVSNIVNGVYSISDSDVVNDLGTTLYAQGIGTDDLLGQQIYAGALANDAPYFVDGRQHMEQNLDFLIRAASANQPFLSISNDFSTSDAGQFNQSSTNFEEFSFLFHSAYSDGALASLSSFQLDDLWPFTANYDLANSFIDTSRTNSPFGSTNFNFQIDFGNSVPAPPILTHDDPYWILQSGFYAYLYYDIGSPPNAWALSVSDDFTSVSLSGGSYNLFGLPFQSGCVVEWTNSPNLSYQELAPGDNINTTPGYIAYDYASWCPAPTLQLTNYYFAPLINPGLNVNTYAGVNLPGELDSVDGPDKQPFPMPIEDDFNVTNQTPAVMFGSVGQPMILGAWAKYSIEGSSPTKYAYLGQYFTTNAWEVDSSGNITSTNAGIVSPYGEFFPTQPGPAALITMTNTDNGTQATGIVNVISLALDANHDGTIDPTWNGADMTSPKSPYVFWANNNFDRWNYDPNDNTNYMDDVQADDYSDPLQNLDPGASDCNYVVGGVRVIPDTRDLEDFARLWVCGITSNLLAALPAGSTVTLNWGDVGSPNPNNPTIDLFAAADTNGGIGYQTNETIATEQINAAQCPYIWRIGPGSNLVLNASQFANNWAGNYFIWCGVSNGTGGLSLTITGPNSNVLGQTTAYIQIEDIKQMYERWTVGDDPTVVPATTAQLATDSLPVGVLSPFQYVNPPAPNTPYILFVHGWNCSPFDKDWFAQTAFKRLYWQGYQGRFGLFRWPTDYGFTGLDQIIATNAEKDNYDRSEYQAWQSAQGLLNKLNDLNSQYSGHVYLLAHSMGNVVASEAVRLTGSAQVVNTYVASQGAVTAHTYDASVPDYSFVYFAYGVPLSLSADTPNIYGDWFATNGNGAGAIINFYNTNDYALSRPVWQLDQLLKPDRSVEEGADIWSYGYSGSVSDPPPWNNFYKTDTNSTTYDFNIVTSLNNRYEVMAFDAQPYTTALGATPGVLNLTRSVNLMGIWLPDPGGQNYAEHFWHSAEFRGDDPQQRSYWVELLGSDAFNLQ